MIIKREVLVKCHRSHLPNKNTIPRANWRERTCTECGNSNHEVAGNVYRVLADPITDAYIELGTAYANDDDERADITQRDINRAYRALSIAKGQLQE